VREIGAFEQGGQSKDVVADPAVVAGALRSLQRLDFPARHEAQEKYGVRAQYKSHH
jgi:hypothetical protein